MTKEEALKLVDYWTKKQIKDHGYKRGQLENLKTQYGEDVYNQVVQAYNVLKDEIEEDNTTSSVGISPGSAASVELPVGMSPVLNKRKKTPTPIFKRALPKMFEESWQNNKLPEFLDKKEAEVWINMSGAPEKYDIEEVRHYCYKIQANRLFYQIVEK